MRGAIVLALLGFFQDQPKPTEEEAARSLEKKVKELMQGLRQAKASQDAEVRDRAARILGEMERTTIRTREDIDAVILEVPATDTSLRKIMEFIAQQTKLPVLASERLQADEDLLEAEYSISGRVNISLPRLLDELCHGRSLAWSIKSGCILVDLGQPLDFGKPIQRAVDVRTLILRTSNAMRRHTSLRDQLGGSGSGGLEEPNSPMLSLDDLITLITENIDPVVWEQSDRYNINATPTSMLLITAPEETHKKIKAYLGGIHKFVNRQWEAKIYLLGMPAARGVKLPEELTAVQWDTLRRQGMEGKEVVVLGYHRMMGYPSQKVGCQSGTSHQLIREYTAEGQPVTAEVFDGFNIRLWAAPDDHGRCSAGIEFSMSKLLAVEKLSTKRGEIQMPEMAHTELYVTRQFPVGTAVVLGRLPGYPGAAAGKDMLVIVGQFTPFTPE